VSTLTQKSLPRAISITTSEQDLLFRLLLWAAHPWAFEERLPWVSFPPPWNPGTPLHYKFLCRSLVPRVRVPWCATFYPNVVTKASSLKYNSLYECPIICRAAVSAPQIWEMGILFLEFLNTKIIDRVPVTSPHWSSSSHIPTKIAAQKVGRTMIPSGPSLNIQHDIQLINWWLFCLKISGWGVANMCEVFAK